MRLFTMEEAVEDFGIDLRDLGQADLVWSLGTLSIGRGRATEVDIKL